MMPQSRDVGAVSRLLARPDDGYVFYGFEDLGSSFAC